MTAPHRRAASDDLASLHAAPLFRPGTSVPGTASPGLPVDLPSDGPHHERGVRHGPGWLRRSLRASLVEGMLAEVVAACAGGALITGWALHLKCSPLLLALFGALPFISQLVHLPAAWFSTSRNRRRLALVSLTASRQLLLGLLAIPLLKLPRGAEQALFAGIVGLSSVLGVIGNNAWMTWMGDLVPTRMRARYFARRATWATVAGALAALGGGLALDQAQDSGHAEWALIALTVVAWVAGTACSLLITRQVDPGPSVPHRAPQLRDLLQPWRCQRGRPMLAYQLLWNAAIGIAASYFGLFLLRDLRTGFTFLALHGALVAGTRALATPLWGRALDRVGARPVLVATSFGIALLPLLWLLPTRTDFIAPLALDAVLGGCLWAGQGLASFQLPLIVATEEQRPFYFAAFASVGGLAFAAAALGGGLLLPLLPKQIELFDLTLNPLRDLFLLSFGLRLLASFASLRMREPASAPVVQLWRGLSWWPAWLRLERALAPVREWRRVRC